MAEETLTPDLAAIARRARRAYMERITGAEPASWWTAIVVTASSARQAKRYEAEIARRLDAGKLPAGALYLVVSDLDDARIGSGGATLNALRALAQRDLADSAAAPSSLEAWWNGRRVLIIHSGGDSRRLPEYSLAGKLFSALPVKTPWGDVSTVFDETLALSTLWAERLPAGLLVASGDVILTFPAEELNWERPGVCGVAMRQPAEVGSGHGVYVIGDEGRVYSFLQKPSAAEVRAAGGMLPGDQVALDIGLLRFDAPVAARLTELAGVRRREGRWVFDPGVLGGSREEHPVIDLYEHITLALTGEWTPADDAHAGLRELAGALRGVPFWCSLVEGDFTHVGTTAHFRRLMTEDSTFRRLYEAHQHLGASHPPGVVSAGVLVDSVLRGGGELGPGSLVIECHLDHPLRAGRGAIVHGLTGLPAPVFVPEDTVAHQAPVHLDDGRTGTVVRVYGVEDDPKQLVSSGQATWFGRPILTVLEERGIDPADVWPDIPSSERCLWNAEVFLLGSPEASWECASWLLGMETGFTPERWRASRRLSLAASAARADMTALSAARERRTEAGWELTAAALADSGTDIRPLLARAPGLTALTAAGRAVERRARDLERRQPTEAASRWYQAGLFLAQAGFEQEAEAARGQAFRCVQQGVEEGCRDRERLAPGEWRYRRVRVAGPARVDFGGGWSDTPPFCLDWGGTVLNAGLSLGGAYPIVSTVTRLEELVVRCLPDEGEPVEYQDAGGIFGPLAPGSSVAIPRAALRLLGIVESESSLAERLRALGGGIEIRTEVDLPVGSGLGTSSILAATLIRALAEMAGIQMDETALSDQVMRLEQMMTTGGGWQDQAGGIFPGVKLVTTGPGLRQRLRVEPVAWSPDRRKQFEERFVLYYTGIRRVAKDLLAQVVGSYLAREVAAVQVLHSIKTLAVEMKYAMQEGEWDYLGQLLDRHWQLNQILDPHTTNAPIEALLREVRPMVAGAKLAGAGGGGFLMMLARSPEAAGELREMLSRPTWRMPGRIFEHKIAASGLLAEHE